MTLNTVMIGLTWAIGIFGVGGTIAVVAAVIFLGPAGVVTIVQPILARFLACSHCIALIVFVLSVVGAYWVGRHGEYQRGHKAAIAEIAAEDKQAVDDAFAARATLQACRTRNGQWDQATGSCQ